jgi:hypothetical protein
MSYVTYILSVWLHTRKKEEEEEEEEGELRYYILNTWSL